MEEVEFEYSADEWVLVMRTHLLHRLRWWASVVISILATLMGVLVLRTGSNNAFGWFTLLYGLFSTFFLLVWMPYRAGLSCKKQRQLQGRITISIDPESVRFRSAAADTRWCALTKVIRTEPVLLLYMNPIMFIALPRRACRDAEQYKRIEQLALRLVET